MPDIGEPNLSQVLETAVEGAAREVRVSLPGIVTAVDMENARVSVQPAIKRLDADNYEPVITDVPIVFPRSKKARITFPIEPDDSVLLIFADRNLDTWLLHGGNKNVAPTDDRMHDITDAFAIPMCLDEIPSDDTDCFCIDFDGSEFRVNANDKVKLGDADDEYVLKGKTAKEAIDAYCQEIADAYQTWIDDGPPSAAVNGAFIEDLSIANATLKATIPDWPSDKVFTE